MEAQDWKTCPLVSIDAEVMHGEPVFRGARMPVEDAIESYYAYREIEGMPDEEAVNAILFTPCSVHSARFLALTRCGQPWPLKP